ncbi:transposase-like protein [Sinorhizobium meliloti]
MSGSRLRPRQTTVFPGGGPYKDRRTVVPALRAIYRARDAEAGLKALEAFEEGYWDQK